MSGCQTRSVDALTVIVGSLDALRDECERRDVLIVEAGADVVVVPTAAAFSGAPESAWAVASALRDVGAAVEAVMVIDRGGASDEHCASRIANADLVVLCDGSPLHARTVWRGTPVGEAIGAARRVVAVAQVASVLGDVMVDPRGGAPTTGLGYRPGLVVTAPSSEEQLARTRSLLSTTEVLAVVGADGVLACEGQRWRVVRGDVVLTRGDDDVTL